MIKAILFDWHGVLDMTSFNAIVIDFLVKKTGEVRQTLQDDFAPMREAYATNKISSEIFWQDVQGNFMLTEHELSHLRNAVTAIEKNDDLWDILPDFKKKYKLAILSDAPLEKVACIRKTVDLSLFDAVHFSSEKGMGKRDDAFFHNLLTELSIAAEEALFVDDTPSKVKKATSLGLHACLFTNVSDIKKALYGETSI